MSDKTKKIPRLADTMAIVYEGDTRRKCPVCGSSLMSHWFGLKLGGCIKPSCVNHDKSL